jgi:hypothetical protein
MKKGSEEPLMGYKTLFSFITRFSQRNIKNSNNAAPSTKAKFK